jgi:hypothetical protein
MQACSWKDHPTPLQVQLVGCEFKKWSDLLVVNNTFKSKEIYTAPTTH